MSTADRLLDQGEKNGEKNGLTKALLKLLKKNFNHIPDWVYNKLESATPEIVDLWFDQALSGKEIQEIFA